MHSVTGRINLLNNGESAFGEKVNTTLHIQEHAETHHVSQLRHKAFSVYSCSTVHMDESGRCVRLLGELPHRMKSIPKKVGKIAHILLGIVSMFLIVSLVATRGFGIMVPQHRASVGDYSWAELKYIAEEISNAATYEDGLRIAAEYALCDADGTLHVDDVKEVMLTDGTSSAVRIIGFRRDLKASGEGLAGITFCFTAPIAEHQYNERGVEVNWDDSDLRSFIHTSTFHNCVPVELRWNLVSVLKEGGRVSSAGKMTSLAVSESFWPLSAAEIIAGMSDTDGDPNGRYQLFWEGRVMLGPIDGELIWTRSSCDEESGESWAVDSAGGLRRLPREVVCGVQPAFCF